MASAKGSKQKKSKKRTGPAVKDRSVRSMLLDKLRDTPDFDKAIVLEEHPDVPKMSQVLLEYAVPLTDPLPKDDNVAFRKAIGLAMICWNAALASRVQRKETLHQFVSEASKDVDLPSEELLDILNFMIQRKNRLFKNNKRVILNYEVKATKKDRQVYVVSSLEPEQMKTVMPGAYKPWWKRLLFWVK